MNYFPSFDFQSALIDHLDPAIRLADLKQCIDVANNCLKNIPATPFHIVSDLNFTNDPKAVAASFDYCFSEERKRGTNFKSVYTETNGFPHNADQWYFNWFAYDYTTDVFDFEYLGFGWESQEYDSIVLSGMEELQALYSDDDNWIDQNEFAMQACECIVIFKFADLIQRATGEMEHFDLPMVASSHDTGIQFQFKRKGLPEPL